MVTQTRTSRGRSRKVSTEVHELDKSQITYPERKETFYQLPADVPKDFMDAGAIEEIRKGVAYLVAAAAGKSADRFDNLLGTHTRLLAVLPAVRGILFKIMDLPDDEAEKRGDIARDGMALLDTVAPAPKTGE